MATITNFGTLKSNVADWLNRSDLTSQIPVFVQLFEAKTLRKWGFTTITGDDADDNWLLLNHPDVYLFGSLLEAGSYLKDDELLARIEPLYAAAEARVRYVDTTGDLDDYAGLQALVADYLERADLDSRIPTFIELAEQSLKRDERVREMSNQGTWTLSADGDALPSDFGRVDEFYHDGPTYYGTIEIVGDLGKVKARRGYTSTGVPGYASIKDERIYYAPEPDDTYSVQMTYFRRIPVLSGTNTTNWLLDDHPDVYLFAALVQAALYLKGDNGLDAMDVEARLPVWKAALDNAIAEMARQEWNQQWGGGSIRRHHRKLGV